MPSGEASTAGFRIRLAVADDAAEILRLIRGLAEYEKAPSEVTNTEAQLREDGWGATPRFTVRPHSSHCCAALHCTAPHSTAEHSSLRRSL